MTILLPPALFVPVKSGPLQGQESSAAQGTRLKREHKISLSGRLG